MRPSMDSCRSDFKKTQDGDQKQFARVPGEPGNTQKPTNDPSLRHWMFDVGFWMLDVSASPDSAGQQSVFRPNAAPHLVPSRSSSFP